MKLNEMEMKKVNKVISVDFDTLCVIVGEYGDEAWDDADIEMLMERHGLTSSEAVAMLKGLSSVLDSINAIAVKAADKAAKEIMGHVDMDDRNANAMYTDVWHSTSKGVRESMKLWLRNDFAAFAAAIKPMR